MPCKLPLPSPPALFRAYKQCTNSITGQHTVQPAFLLKFSSWRYQWLPEKLQKLLRKYFWARKTWSKMGYLHCWWRSHTANRDNLSITILLYIGSKLGAALYKLQKGRITSHSTTACDHLPHLERKIAFLNEILGSFFSLLYLVIYLSMKNKCSMLSSNVQREEYIKKKKENLPKEIAFF